MNEVHFLNVEYVLVAIYHFFQNFDFISIINWILWFIAFLRPVALVLTLILLTIIVYCYIRIKQINDENKAKEVVSDPQEPMQEKELNEKWIKVQELINSTNPNDWRVAILEADIMLGDVLVKAGFRGDSIGEQLKSVGKGDMVTLDQAWEAHKIRNLIAHGGNDYKLNEREVKRTIELFKKVFEEFYHI